MGWLDSLFSSPRDRASEDLNRDIRQREQALGQMSFNAGNQFANYSMPFNYQQKSAELDKWMNNQLGVMNRDTASNISAGNQDISRRLASQGAPIGGSFMNQLYAQNTDANNKNNYNAQAQLRGTRLSQNADLMGQQNQDQFNIAQGSQMANQANTQFGLSKEQILAQLMGQRGGAVGQMSDESPFGQILGMVNTGLGFIPSFKGAGGFGQAVAGRRYRG